MSLEMTATASTMKEFQDQVALEMLEEISAAERARRSAWNRHILIGRLLIGVIMLGAWQIVSGTLVDPFWISKPTEVLARLGTWIQTGYLFIHLGVTLWEMTVGFVLGLVVGIAVGFALGQSRTLSELLTPFISAFFSMPRIALAPLFILWFGIGLWSKVALVFLMVFFLVFYNTFAGVRDVNAELINKVRLMGATRGQLMRKVILPAAGTWIFAGLKVAVPFSLIAAVVAEIVASNRGLGYVIEHSSGMFDTAGIFAALFVLMLIGLVLNVALVHLESRLLRWKIGRSGGPEGMQAEVSFRLINPGIKAIGTGCQRWNSTHSKKIEQQRDGDLRGDLWRASPDAGQLHIEKLNNLDKIFKPCGFTVAAFPN